MKSPGSSNLLLILSLFFAFVACKKEGNPENQSTVSSIAINSNLPWMYGVAIDQNRNVIYVGFLDFQNTGSIIKKIDLANLSEIKSVFLSDVYFDGADPLVSMDNGNLIMGLREPVSGYHTITQMDPDLNIIRSDTFDRSPSDARIKLCNAGPGRISGVENLRYGANNFLRFKLMDNSGNILKTLDDSSKIYNDLTVGARHRQISDGNFLYLGRNVIPPLNDNDILLEKRDQDYQLIWRTEIRGPGSQLSTFFVENNGKIYIYGAATDPDNSFATQLNFWILDADGNLLETKSIKSGGIDETLLDVITPTEDGGFLITALTSFEADPKRRRGILYKTDANLNVIKSMTYGGSSTVFNGTMIKTGPNKYLLIYDDNSFLPDGNNYRMVMRYVDQNGDFIK